MTTFNIAAAWATHPSGEDAGEAMSRVTIAVDNKSVSQFRDPVSGRVFAGPVVPTVDLAIGLAENWWPLLNEPAKFDRDPGLRPRVRPDFAARHRLDVFLPGYVFPPIGIWSGGDGLIGTQFEADERFQSLRYVKDATDQPIFWNLDRTGTEEALARFVKGTMQHVKKRSSSCDRLRDAWSRVSDSLADPDEMRWCLAVGRLGLDPYDHDAPDIQSLSDGLSDDLFRDVCEAVPADQLTDAVAWTRDHLRRLVGVSAISLEGFGGAIRADLTQPAWRNGRDAADIVRERLSLPPEPELAVRTLLGDALPDRASEVRASGTRISGLVRRSGKVLDAVVAADGQAGKRFGLCRAAYLGWVGASGSAAAVTTSETRRQQASRAFAAEMVAPIRLLKQRAGTGALTERKMQDLGREWVCSPTAIYFQARNNGIPVQASPTRD